MPFPKLLVDFGEIVAALLIVLDPLATLPVFAVLWARMEPREARCLTAKVIGGATVLLLFFTITGTWVLRLFGVTLDDLRVGGGLLLLIIALRMVVEGNVVGERDGGYRAAIVPVISPLLIGPGAITAAVVMAAIYGMWLTVAAGVAAMLVSLVLLLAGNFIHRVIGESGTMLVTRIMGVLIATIAVSYIRVGIVGYLRMWRAS